MRLLSAVCGMVFIVSCGPVGTTPTPQELAGDELKSIFAVKNDDNGNNGNNGNHYGQENNGNNGNHYGQENNGNNGNGNGNQCITSADPMSDLMPTSRLSEGFEGVEVGDMPPQYRWLDAANTTMAVTNEVAHSGNKSLKIITSPGAKRTTGVRFCVRCEAMERFKAEFSIRFDSFISWNGLMVTNNPKLAYWWWVRSNGTVFDDPQNTAATLQAKVWHDVQIDINRKKDLARLTVDGKDYSVPLVGTWYDGAADQPMGCFRVMTLTPAQKAQTLYIDNIRVHAIM